MTHDGTRASLERRAFEITRTILDSPSDEEALSVLVQLAKELVSARDAHVFVPRGERAPVLACSTATRTVTKDELAQCLEAASEALDRHAARQSARKVPDTDESAPLSLVAKVLADREHAHAVLVVVRDGAGSFSIGERRDFTLLADHAANGLARRASRSGALGVPILGPPRPRRDAATEERVHEIKTRRFVKPPGDRDEPIGGLVGRSGAIREVRDLVRRFAAVLDPVLIQGESGTGKELVARALHALSPRRDGPFVGVNCAALAADVVESLLFGHVKGAFTGADKPRPGFLRDASGGTLFLDELGELPLEIQAKLLRALEEKTVTPVGSTKAIPIDVRIVAATNRDLEELIRAHRFRDDLFQRLCVLDIFIPPLRERLEDIPLIVAKLLEDLAREGRPLTIARDALSALGEAAWRGNVRELRNKIRKAATFASGEIRAEHFELERAPVAPPGPTLEEAGRAAVERALLESGGNKSKAAQVLGIDRATLRRHMKKHGLE